MVDMGFTASSAAGVLVWANVGGATGGVVLGLLSLICAITGFFTNAGVVGLYGILVQVFPTYVRATGTGFAIGIGRAGAMLAPIVAGYLFHEGYGLEFVAVTMGVGSLVAAVAVWLLPFQSATPPALAGATQAS